MYMYKYAVPVSHSIDQFPPLYIAHSIKLIYRYAGCFMKIDNIIYVH